MSIVEENHALSLRLRARGVDVLGSPASELTLSLVQKFLDLKARRAF